MILLVDYCSREAARFAVERYHYSRVMPAGKAVHIGCWENGRFVGAMVFSRGACPYASMQFGVSITEACELTRVALCAHRAPVSRMMRFALAKLSAICPDIRVVVSFADPEHGHVGRIYQAAGWVYTGQSEQTAAYLFDGRWRHERSIWPRRRRDLAEAVKAIPGKHRYVLPLDRSLRSLLASRSLPYPKAVVSGGSAGLGIAFENRLALL